jgi:alpha-L-rhamnosidase
MSAFSGISWSGNWIAPEEPRVPSSPISFGGEVPPHAFSRVLFRRTFEVDEVPATAPARLTADSRYVLLVNGQEVGRGPIRSQPRRLRYDEYDLAPFLVSGTNVIAAIVTYYGRANAFWQPAATSGGLGTDALLVFEAKLGGGLLISDDRWVTQRSTAWSTFEKDALDGVPAESLDARELPSDWAEVGFDDSSWIPSTIARAKNQGGFARSTPPTDPFGALLERGIGALGGETVAASALTDSSSRTLVGDWRTDHPAARIQQLLGQETVDAAAGSLPIDATVSATVIQHVSIDFGRIVAGFVEVDLDAPAGTVVDLHYRELEWEAGHVELLSAPNSGGRYIARGHDDRYRALEVNGLRYLHLAIHAEREATVRVEAVRIREYIYPWSGDAFFRSNDDEITALYETGIRTVNLNSFDSFTDCPTREQRAWVGDGVVHQMVHLTTNTDWRLARNYLRLGDSPRSDHMLPMSVVGEIEFGDATTIPDWALHWVHGVHNSFRYSGVDDELLSLLPTVEKVLRWYEPYVDEFGTISDVPEWNLVDWASVFSTGRSSILTSLWARGLAEFAEISDAVGNAGSARWARGRWEAARAGFEDFWDESRGTYVDHILPAPDGSGAKRMPAASQAAGATAIVSGLAPRERWSRIIDVITDADALVVRSWIGGNDGGYDLQKMIEQSEGIQRIDWDVDREIVLAEPFYSYVVHDAVAAAGRGGDLVTLLRRWSVFLADGYDTFGECWGWGTPVHGWSSTPTRDLVSYVLGVTPDEPGYTRVRVAPAPGPLTELEGAVPTPFGLVTVRIARGEVSIDSPVPVTFVDAVGIEHALGAGESSLPL